MANAVAVAQLTALLKRVALVLYPRSMVASLSGDAWLTFLQRSSRCQSFTTGAGQILGNAGYQRQIAPDYAQLAQLAELWLRAHMTGPNPDMHTLPPQVADPWQAPARDLRNV